MREPEAQQLADKKMGCSNEHPLKAFGRNYRFFAAFFFAPLAAFFAIGFLSSRISDSNLGLTTWPVTTGGLSHPPSYQM